MSSINPPNSEKTPLLPSQTSSLPVTSRRVFQVFKASVENQHRGVSTQILRESTISNLTAEREQIQAKYPWAKNNFFKRVVGTFKHALYYLFSSSYRESYKKDMATLRDNAQALSFSYTLSTPSLSPPKTEILEYSLDNALFQRADSEHNCQDAAYIERGRGCVCDGVSSGGDSSGVLAHGIKEATAKWLSQESSTIARIKDEKEWMNTSTQFLNSLTKNVPVDKIEDLRRTAATTCCFYHVSGEEQKTIHAASLGDSQVFLLKLDSANRKVDVLTPLPSNKKGMADSGGEIVLMNQDGDIAPHIEGMLNGSIRSNLEPEEWMVFAASDGLFDNLPSTSKDSPAYESIGYIVFSSYFDTISTEWMPLYTKPTVEDLQKLPLDVKIPSPQTAVLRLKNYVCSLTARYESALENNANTTRNWKDSGIKPDDLTIIAENI